MKPTSIYIATTTVLVLSTIGLLTQHTAAIAQQEPRFPSPAQLQQLSRDLIPSRSQDFFREGQARMEAEIKQLGQTPESDILTVDRVGALELDNSFSDSSNNRLDFAQPLPQNSANPSSR
jgi:hypothetical protein